MCMLIPPISDSYLNYPGEYHVLLLAKSNHLDNSVTFKFWYAATDDFITRRTATER